MTSQMKFGTILVDPPWGYQRTSSHGRLHGYSDKQYHPLSTQDLIELPVRELAAPDCVLILWATYPFIADALKVVAAWGFEYVTGITWVKTVPSDTTMTKVDYGVGYWFRGATEPILIGKIGRSYRTHWQGILSPTLGHSRKPDGIYQLAEFFPGPRLELFARTNEAHEVQPNPPTLDDWYQLGDECKRDGEDIRDVLPRLTAGASWSRYGPVDDHADGHRHRSVRILRRW
jgi:N6-adenosine-specific RNA methylase IME4